MSNAMLMRTQLWQSLKKDAARLEANDIKKRYGPKPPPKQETAPVEEKAAPEVPVEPSVDELAALVAE